MKMALELYLSYSAVDVVVVAVKLNFNFHLIFCKVDSL